MLHEDTHLPDTECPRKAQCEWGNVADRFPRDWYSRADSECKAYRAQRSCLYRAANMLCGDDLECWQQMLAEIDKVTDRVKDWCRPDYPRVRRGSL
jgi:hypothetical protein